jgi:hypothetical protein
VGFDLAQTNFLPHRFEKLLPLIPFGQRTSRSTGGATERLLCGRKVGAVRLTLVLHCYCEGRNRKEYGAKDDKRCESVILSRSTDGNER